MLQEARESPHEKGHVVVIDLLKKKDSKQSFDKRTDDFPP